MIDPDLIEVYAELSKAAQSECRTRPEYMLGTNLVRGQMVYQAFMGTQVGSSVYDRPRGRAASPRGPSAGD